MERLLLGSLEFDLELFLIIEGEAGGASCRNELLLSFSNGVSFSMDSDTSGSLANAGELDLLGPAIAIRALEIRSSKL